MPIRWRSLVVGIAGVLYVASLLLPVASYSLFLNSTTSVFTGWDVFKAGGLAILRFDLQEVQWWLCVSVWIVNPLIWIALVTTFLGRYRIAFGTSAAALLLGFTVLIWAAGPVAGYPGYWTWLSSACVPLVASAWSWLKFGAARNADPDIGDLPSDPEGLA